MGRKPKIQEAEQTPEKQTKMVYDRVGERTDLFLCPECSSHPDCFAWMEGRCTALNFRADTENCGFYKPTSDALADAKGSYQRLKEGGRSDLVHAYIKPLSALGMLDDEIESAERYGEEFDTFAEDDFQKQLDKAMEGDSLEELNSLLDDEEAAEDTDEEEDDDAADDDPWDAGRS